MTVKGSSQIKVHVFTVDGNSTYVVEPIGGAYGGKCGDWYELFPSKRFDSLEEAMREVVELQHRPQPRPQLRSLPRPQPQHRPQSQHQPAFL